MNLRYKAFLVDMAPFFLCVRDEGSNARNNFFVCLFYFFLGFFDLQEFESILQPI